MVYLGLREFKIMPKREKLLISSGLKKYNKKGKNVLC